MEYRAEKNLRFYASAIKHFASESHYMEDVAINYTLRKPLGVVACISPWNLPLYLFLHGRLPTLAAGNCVVAKPSEITRHCTLMVLSTVGEMGSLTGCLTFCRLELKVGDALNKIIQT